MEDGCLRFVARRDRELEAVRSMSKKSRPIAKMLLLSHSYDALSQVRTFLKLSQVSQHNQYFATQLTSVDAELNAEFAISPTLIPIYLALKASEAVTFLIEDEILSEVSKIVKNAAEDNRIVQTVQEVARAKGSELHNISALTGGMVSQEIIKIITKQYIPIDNTCVFDGITSRTQILKT
jgi:amyloid beta precursor protein binding protein 1